MKHGFKGDIEKLTLENTDFRHILYSGEYSQLVLMSLIPGEEIGFEIHDGIDQFFRFEQGIGRVFVNDVIYEVADGDAVIVPSGSKHNVVNISETEDLKFYTIYSPAHHKDGMVRHTKKEAEASDPEFEGITTEK